MLIEQSAALPYRRLPDGSASFLLVTCLTTRRWIIPKWHVERNMTAHASAAKEALEEAGVVGKISPRLLGKYQYDKLLPGGGVRRAAVRVYPLAVKKEKGRWDEMHIRERAWFPANEAVARTDEPGLQAIMRMFAAEVASGTNAPG